MLKRFLSITVREKFYENKGLYERSCRRPFSFGVPDIWYRKKLRYLKRLKNIMNGKNPFEAIR